MSNRDPKKRKKPPAKNPYAFNRFVTEPVAFEPTDAYPLPPMATQSKDKNDDNDKEENEEEDDNESDDLNYEPDSDDVPTLFDGELLENFFKDVTGVSLTKEGYEIAVSRLKEMKLVSKALKGTASRSREQQYSQYYDISADGILYCTNIAELISTSYGQYDPSHWRLNIDKNIVSLKAFLVHNDNELPIVLIAYGRGLKETHEVISKFVELIDYESHKWLIVCDLKMIALLFGMQQGYVQHMCVYCTWQSRTKDKDLLWSTNFALRTVDNVKVGENSIIREPSISFAHIDKIIPPPLHIRIGIMYAFLTAILGPSKRQSPQMVTYLMAKFSKTEAKVKAGTFDGKQIKKLFSDNQFINFLEPNEKKAWKSFMTVSEDFLGNNRTDDYAAKVKQMISDFRAMGASLTVKLHLLHAHLDRFPSNCGQFSDEQAERGHQQLLPYENRFKGDRGVSFAGEVFHGLKRSISEHQRKAIHKRNHR